MKLSKISNYLSNIGIVLAIYSMYKIYITKKSLPPGACPIENYNYLLYLTIAIIILSLIIAIISEKIEKNSE
ncbi:hypothetical protein [Clostridium sp.]|uniref:hypothetical protein n=1 Tax=Clostridium sp. TaxID=1506 RepID=UPI002FCC79CB